MGPLVACCPATMHTSLWPQSKQLDAPNEQMQTNKTSCVCFDAQGGGGLVPWYGV